MNRSRSSLPCFDAACIPVLLLLLAVFLSDPLASQSTVKAASTSVQIPPAGVGKSSISPFFTMGCVPNERPALSQFFFRVPKDIPASVRSVAFRRRDAPNATRGTYPASAITVELGMGHLPRTTANFSLKLPDNQGRDFQIVATKKQVRFPAQPKLPGNRYPFAYRIPLDRPFSFRPGSTGLLQFRLFATTFCGTNAQVTFDWYFMNRKTKLPTYFGRRCANTPYGNILAVFRVFPGNTSLGMMAGDSPIANGARVRIFGGLSKDFWRGLKLPFPLDSLGAPGCTLYISLDWEWPLIPGVPNNGRYSAYADFTLPNNPALAGMTIYAQGLNFNADSNNLGLATSQGVKIPINRHVEPYESLLFGGNAAPNKVLGKPSIGYGPVFLLSSR